MAEERKDQEQPESEEPEADAPQGEGQMQSATPPEAQSLSEEVAARRELEAQAEASGDQAESDKPADETDGTQEPKGTEEDTSDRPLSEDVAEAGELLTDDVPSGIADEAVRTVEHQTSKATEDVGPKAGLTGDETEAASEGRSDEEQSVDEGGEPPAPGNDEVESESNDEAASRKADDDRPLSEDVSDAGETLAEAPAALTDEAVRAGEDLVEEAEEASILEEESEAEEEADDPDDGQENPQQQTGTQRTVGAGPTAAAAGIPAARPTAPRPPREHRPSRRTLAREERRRRSEARRSRRRLIYGILGGSVAAMLILGLVMGDLGGLTPTSPPANGGQQPPERVGTQMEIQENGTIMPGEDPPQYNSTPPTSGPSYAEPAPWGVHDERQEDPAIVRNMQIGGVVFNHNLTDAEELQELSQYVSGLPQYPGCYVLHPYPEIPEGTVVLTAWGWMQEFDGFNRSGKETFVNSHRNRAPLFESQTCGYEPPEAQDEEPPGDPDSEDEPVDQDQAEAGE